MRTKTRQRPMARKAGSTKTPPRHEWNYTQPMWVIGTVDSNGAIRGRAAGNDSMHKKSDGPGRRWRWNVWEGEFHSVLGGRDNLTPEEADAVEDWLDSMSYIHPQIRERIEDARNHRKTLGDAT